MPSCSSGDQRKRRPPSKAYSISAPEERLRFAKCLRRLRGERGYTQSNFARALEIAESRYGRYERAEVEPIRARPPDVRGAPSLAERPPWLAVRVIASVGRCMFVTAGILWSARRVLCGSGQQHPFPTPQAVHRIAIEIVNDAPVRLPSGGGGLVMANWPTGDGGTRSIAPMVHAGGLAWPA